MLHDYFLEIILINLFFNLQYEGVNLWPLKKYLSNDNN